MGIPPKPDPAALAAKRKAEEPPLPPPDPQPRKKLITFKGSPATQMARRILSKEFMQGEVAEWDGDHGWIKCFEQIKHPSCQQQGGYAYVRIGDVVGGTALIPGRMVEFKPFSDARCFGAAEVIQG